MSLDYPFLQTFIRNKSRISEISDKHFMIMKMFIKMINDKNHISVHLSKTHEQSRNNFIYFTKVLKSNEVLKDHFYILTNRREIKAKDSYSRLTFSVYDPHKIRGQSFNSVWIEEDETIIQEVD